MPHLTPQTETRRNAFPVTKPGVERALQEWCRAQLPCHRTARPHGHPPSQAPVSQAPRPPASGTEAPHDLFQLRRDPLCSMEVLIHVPCFARAFSSQIPQAAV